jgi:nitroimidazol reductase NimA-like FMN-containing flavoprotein (pyridoxamine 5'-phosphate oxidase superfamily)
MKEDLITDREIIREIVEAAPVCRIGFCVDDVPYVIPMNFGYRDPFVYLHTGRSGKKLDIIARNDNVCFEVDIDHELALSPKPCVCGMKYRSAVGFGKAYLVEDRSEKVEALNAIMDHYASSSSHQYPGKVLDKTVILKIRLDTITARVRT